MANIAYTARTASPITRLRCLFATVQENWTLHKEYRKTRDELASLTDRELADIGVARADIADLARVHVYGA
jgi:uncharacterized protein YjiS (DUF1127 family)